jgi:hypothetical protein
VEIPVTRTRRRAPIAEPSRSWLLAPVDRRHRRRRRAQWKGLLPGPALLLLALALAALLAEALAILML